MSREPKSIVKRYVQSDFQEEGDDFVDLIMEECPEMVERLIQLDQLVRGADTTKDDLTKLRQWAADCLQPGKRTCENKYLILEAVHSDVDRTVGFDCVRWMSVELDFKYVRAVAVKTESGRYTIYFKNQSGDFYKSKSEFEYPYGLPMLFSSEFYPNATRTDPPPTVKTVLESPPIFQERAYFVTKVIIDMLDFRERIKPLGRFEEAMLKMYYKEWSFDLRGGDMDATLREIFGFALRSCHAYGQVTEDDIVVYSNEGNMLNMTEPAHKVLEPSSDGHYRVARFEVRSPRSDLEERVAYIESFLARRFP